MGKQKKRAVGPARSGTEKLFWLNCDNIEKNCDCR